MCAFKQKVTVHGRNRRRPAMHGTKTNRRRSKGADDNSPGQVAVRTCHKLLPIAFDTHEVCV